MDKSKKLRTIDLVYIGLSAGLITICAWVTIPMTIPITLQTLGVCLVASLFGAKRGTLAVVIYLLLGAIGLPVFSGFKGGIGTLLGSTGGYAVGFIFTALIIGIVADKTNKLPALIASMIVGIIVLYAFGTAWFAIVYARGSEPASLASILGWCVIPFIIPDAVKLVIAGVLTKQLKKFIK